MEAGFLEECESGRIGTIGNRVKGNLPWVQIPPPPPLRLEGSFEPDNSLGRVLALGLTVWRNKVAGMRSRHQQDRNKDGANDPNPSEHDAGRRHATSALTRLS